MAFGRYSELIKCWNTWSENRFSPNQQSFSGIPSQGVCRTRRESSTACLLLHRQATPWPCHQETALRWAMDYQSLRTKPTSCGWSSYRWHRKGSFLPFLFFIGPKMVHFAHFKFSSGLKSLISAVFIFRWSLPVSVQPFFSRKLSQKSTISFQSEQFSAIIT